MVNISCSLWCTSGMSCCFLPTGRHESGGREFLWRGLMGIGRNINHERLDDLRRGRGPVQEHIIDEYVAGRLSRRDFIRKGSAIGLSMGVIGGILAACGSSGTSSSGSTSAPAGKAGA